jgi:hypothetical protein
VERNADDRPDPDVVSQLVGDEIVELPVEGRDVDVYPGD